MGEASCRPAPAGLARRHSGRKRSYRNRGGARQRVRESLQDGSLQAQKRGGTGCDFLLAGAGNSRDHHESQNWAPHVADEFQLISSGNDHPLDKKDRMDILDRQKKAGSGSAPAPLVSARMFDFPDTVVMTALHQSPGGKPTHVTRIWIKRDGRWQLAYSQQTTVQQTAAAGKKSRT